MCDRHPEFISLRLDSRDSDWRFRACTHGSLPAGSLLWAAIRQLKSPIRGWADLAESGMAANGSAAHDSGCDANDPNLRRCGLIWDKSSQCRT